MVRSHPKFKLKEVPFSFKKRMFGETKRNLFVFIFTYIVTLFRLRFS
jgi:dolichol-phosphate mannosyltransferase